MKGLRTSLTVSWEVFYIVKMDAKLMEIDIKIWLATNKPSEAHHQAPIIQDAVQINACA